MAEMVSAASLHGGFDGGGFRLIGSDGLVNLPFPSGGLRTLLTASLFGSGGLERISGSARLVLLFFLFRIPYIETEISFVPRNNQGQG